MYIMKCLNYTNLLFVLQVIFSTGLPSHQPLYQPCHFDKTSSLNILASFGTKNQYSLPWRVTNDPVMGGESTGKFNSSDNTGRFSGKIVNVPSLKTAGFSKLSSGVPKLSFPDIGTYLDGNLTFCLKSNSSYRGFKVSFLAKGIPRISIYSKGSFKAPFHIPVNNGNTWELVDIPFNRFSYDWSAYTGSCNTTDPNGRVHHCCHSSDGGKYCPNTKYLNSLTGFEVWAEGVNGVYDVELAWIGVLDRSFNQWRCLLDEIF